MFEWLKNFVAEHGFYGSMFYAWIVIMILFFLKLIVYRTKEFPEDIEEMTYYSGYPNLNNMVEGRLRIEQRDIVFESNDEKIEYFKIQILHVKDLEVKDEDVGILVLAFMGSYIGLQGWLQYLFINAKDENGKEIRIQFAARTKSNRLNRVKNLILQVKNNL